MKKKEELMKMAAESAGFDSFDQYMQEKPEAPYTPVHHVLNIAIHESVKDGYGFGFEAAKELFKPKWIPVSDGLPKKPGLKNYEHVRCLVYVRRHGQMILMWNCEHNCWDDESGDDFSHYHKDVTHYQILGPDPV